MQDTATIEKKETSREALILHDFVKKVRDTFRDRVEKIILHGSRARGDADEDSDYDLVILLDRVTEDDKEKIRDLNWEISYQYNTVLMALPIKASEFREDKYFYFYENVCKEGVEL